MSESSIRTPREWLERERDEVEGWIRGMPAEVQEQYRADSGPHGALAELDQLADDRRKLAEDLLAIAELSMPASYFQTDSRCQFARSVLGIEES